MKKLLAFLALIVSSHIISVSLFALPTSEFSLDPVSSNLVQSEGILYTKTGSLSLSGTVSPNVVAIEFSGTTSVGDGVYFSGNTLSDINSHFPLSTSLTGGVYDINALDGSGALLGSEELVIDKATPKAQSITYFDDNRNGKIDRLVMTMNENISGNVPLPYSGSLTLSTRKNGLFSYTISSAESSDYIQSVAISGQSITIGLIEGDMIKNTLSVNTNPGSSASDLKFGVYTNANIADIAGNVFSLALSKFPNSSTGIINGTSSIDALDTGFLNGAYFSGALAVPKIDSRGFSGSLILSGITLTISADSYIGDGNTLRIASGSKVQGNMTLSLGSGGSILDGSGNILYSNVWYAPFLETLSGSLILSGTTLSESGMVFSYNGLVGSGLLLEILYETASGLESVYSGSLTDNSSSIPFFHVFSSGSFRAKVWKEADVSDALLPGIKILLDNRILSAIDISAEIISTGSVYDITSSGATLSGALFSPIGGIEKVYYGTGELSESGVVQSGNFAFSWLVGDATYLYRLGFTPFPLWNEIFSATLSFQTPKVSPDVVFVFQQWSYVTNPDTTLSDYTCDTIHADCRVNFDLSQSFTGGFSSSDFDCELDFWLEAPTGQEAKCNPATVIFPRGGDYAVRFRIVKKSDASIFSERVFSLHSPSIPPISSWWGGSYVSPVITASSSTWISVSIADPTIVIQSWLDANNRCLKSDCTLNFEYKVLGPKEACHWDFPGGSYLSGTENKCNPGYIHYPFGEFSVTLRVFEQGNISNSREKILRFSNGTSVEIHQAIASPTNHPPVVMVKLQGTLGKTKKQQGNSVACIWVDECSINLSGEESYDLDHDTLTYFWNFWNGVTSDTKNPPAVRYTVGEYSATLRITDSKGFSNEAVFRVSVLGKNQKETVSSKPLDLNVFSLKVTGVSPNPLGNDGVSEWVEITNPLGLDVSLAGCALDDDPEKGSNPYLFTPSTTVRASSVKRFYKLQTSLNFNNTGDSANLFCDGKLASTLAWDYLVPEGFVVSGKEWPYSGKIRTKVLRVIDGDTIEIKLYGKQEKVRLIGVDTPETVDPRKVVQYYGKEASNYVRSQLEGREVELEFDFNPRDKYDRLLAYVWIDGRNFDSELIRLGYARAYLRFPFRYFKEFEKLGRESEKNKVGMWADAEVKKLLNADAKEDKKALEKQLKEEDIAILDDLIKVVEDTKIGSEKLESEVLDRLLLMADGEETADKAKYTKIREVLLDKGIEDIHISLQWSFSKNRKLSGNTFTCYTKLLCSANFTAGKVRKDTIYLWDFGNDETFYGANPLSRKFSIGKHSVILKVFDTKTSNIREENFQVIVKKLATVKKAKIPKTASVKIGKPLVIKWQDYFSPPPLDTHEFSPLQASTSAGVLVLVFFGGVHVIMRRKNFINK